MATDEVVHIVVSGRVPGVGFRFFAESVARRLGVAGWVRNLPGGDVEILARLDPARKAAFLADLEQGPPMGRVENLRVRPAPAGLECPAAGFRLRH